MTPPAPAAPLRVLVADDSPTARMVLVALLDGQPDMCVVGEAADGAEAVDLTLRLRPDVITMDIVMPDLDGLEATRQIMAVCPVPIVIVSGIVTTDHEMDVTMRALDAGALGVLCRPTAGMTADAARRFAETIRSLADVKVVRHRIPLRFPGIGMTFPAGTRPGPAARIGIVGIIASTGGPAALRTMLGALGPRLAVPVLVVQHMTPGYTDGFAHWLDREIGHEVKVADDGERLRAGTVYVAPSGSHLGVSSDGHVMLLETAPVDSFRPSGTVLFESIAACGLPAAAVVMTGMGDDGVAGLAAIHSNRGTIIVQDEATSVVFGIPSAALQAGYGDEVLPLEGIAGRLRALTG